MVREGYNPGVSKIQLLQFLKGIDENNGKFEPGQPVSQPRL
jgi:hypothetical protein